MSKRPPAFILATTILLSAAILAACQLWPGSGQDSFHLEVQMLPVPPGRYGDWDLSPDGRYLALKYRQAGTAAANIALAELDTGRVISITHYAQGTSILDQPHTVSWLPDGRLVVTHAEGPTQETRLHYERFWVVDLQTGAERRLSPVLVEALRQNPSWASDGLWAIFSANPQDGIYPYLQILDVQAESVRRVDFPLAVRKARWSPDGTQLAIVAGEMSPDFAPQYGQVQGAVYIAAAERVLSGQSVEWQDLRQVAQADLWGYDGTAWVDWSPDGRWLVYEWTRGGQHGVWLIASDGSGKPKRLLQGGGYYLPVWFPNGKELLLAKSQAGQTVASPIITFYRVDISSCLSDP